MSNLKISLASLSCNVTFASSGNNESEESSFPTRGSSSSANRSRGKEKPGRSSKATERREPESSCSRLHSRHRETERA